MTGLGTNTHHTLEDVIRIQLLRWPNATPQWRERFRAYFTYKWNLSWLYQQEMMTMHPDGPTARTCADDVVDNMNEFEHAGLRWQRQVADARSSAMVIVWGIAAAILVLVGIWGFSWWRWG